MQQPAQAERFCFDAPTWADLAESHVEACGSDRDEDPHDAWFRQSHPLLEAQLPSDDAGCVDVSFDAAPGDDAAELRTPPAGRRKARHASRYQSRGDGMLSPFPGTPGTPETTVPQRQSRVRFVLASPMSAGPRRRILRQSTCSSAAAPSDTDPVPGNAAPVRRALGLPARRTASTNGEVDSDSDDDHSGDEGGSRAGTEAVSAGKRSRLRSASATTAGSATSARSVLSSPKHSLGLPARRRADAASSVDDDNDDDDGDGDQAQEDGGGDEGADEDVGDGGGHMSAVADAVEAGRTAIASRSVRAAAASRRPGVRHVPARVVTRASGRLAGAKRAREPARDDKENTRNPQQQQQQPLRRRRVEASVTPAPTSTSSARASAPSYVTSAAGSVSASSAAATTAAHRALQSVRGVSASSAAATTAARRALQSVRDVKAARSRAGAGASARIHTTRDIRAWEQQSGMQWAQLDAAGRAAANSEMSAAKTAAARTRAAAAKQRR